MVPDGLPELNRNVERLLGRCLLRLQNYERLLKGLLACSYFAGEAEESEVLRRDRADQFAKVTLGNLVKSLFDKGLLVSGGQSSTFDERQLTPESMAAFEFRSWISMPEEQVAQSKDSLKDLVTLRNDLVHHLGDKFDLSAIEGCMAASRHLEACDATIEIRYRELHGWAMGQIAVQQAMHDLVRSGALRDIIIRGIQSDKRNE